MRLERASFKAIKFACLNFHYAKSVPVSQLAFSVFNDSKEWCGVIIYSTGANPNIGNAFRLPQGGCIELVRVALNGKQDSTSKAVSISLLLLKKICPLVRLCISYADIDQSHTGIIYQASNWVYIGAIDVDSKKNFSFLVNGKKTHRRTINSGNEIQNIEWVRKNLDRSAEIIYHKGKHKYIYPLEKSLIPLCKQLSKPYPKKEQNAQQAKETKQPATSGKEGGSSPTVALN